MLKIFNYFSKYRPTIRTESLKEFCEFVQIEYRTLLCHSKTRWLSFPLCKQNFTDVASFAKLFSFSRYNSCHYYRKFFEDDLREAGLWFVHSLMSVFYHNILSAEKEKNSIADIMYILTGFIKYLMKERIKFSSVSKLGKF